MMFTPIRYDAAALSAYASLFSLCFPASARLTARYLDWLYCKNPDGLAIGFDAWDGNRLAAHYVCVPARASVGGREVKAMLSLNTATHPEHQGKGLFTRLAQLTYDAGAAANLDCVFGVANTSSTGGFKRKLGFQVVQPLEARIGVRNPGIDWDAVGRTAQFARRWTPESLAWRCANPKNPVFSRKSGHRILFHAAAMGGVVQAYGELPLHFAPDFIENPSVGFVSPVRIFIGLVPKGACRFESYISIPQRLRPSPLNFIYRSLSGLTTVIDLDHGSFSFLDFDAY